MLNIFRLIRQTLLPSLFSICLRFLLHMTSSYQQQLDAKIERITAQFAEFAPPSLEVFQSPEKNFRMRAEFRIWHTEDDMFYAMFERDEDNQKKVDSY